ncbi:hypothetical protein [Wolbachia pipientis]|uniref:hypothetical protein n=1 Tax=Wolbachia pipientis TaxID=955 RepID=UPI0025A3148C|nr:hypothetical protein [Wolbachia pipientis]MDM8335572.1 hypothetical protein [Wolbachia pipientis]
MAKPVNHAYHNSDIGKLFGAINYEKVAILGITKLLITAGSITLVFGVADVYIK